MFGSLTDPVRCEKHQINFITSCPLCAQESADSDRPSLAAAGWQPIKTAPRDGQNILIRFGKYDGISQAKYIPGLPHPWQFIDTQNGISWMINHAIDGRGGPSHWRPLDDVTTDRSSCVAPDGVSFVPRNTLAEWANAVRMTHPEIFDQISTLLRFPIAPDHPLQVKDSQDAN